MHSLVQARPWNPLLGLRPLPLASSLQPSSLALVSSSAPRATNETSPSVGLRATYTGPLNSRLIAVAVLLSGMKTTLSAFAPSDACQGESFSLVAMTS